MARKFQSTCDEIFVVTDIKRGVDDPVIKEVIQDMSTTADVGKITRANITVICSHTGVSFRSLLLAISFPHIPRLKLPCRSSPESEKSYDRVSLILSRGELDLCCEDLFAANLDLI